MKSEAWTKAKEAGDQWYELTAQLDQARQQVVELEQQAGQAYVAFQEALAAIELTGLSTRSKGGRSKRNGQRSQQPATEEQADNSPEDACRPN